jgi:hypothetical protein
MTERPVARFVIIISIIVTKNNKELGLMWVICIFT